MSSESKHKLYYYEIVPPQEVWSKIAAELDDSDLMCNYPSRLQHFETNPPLFLWKKIAEALDSKSEPAIPQKRIFFPILKYAAAAAILAFLIWGGSQILSKHSAETETAGNGNKIKKDTVSLSENPASPNDEVLSLNKETTVPTEQETRDEEALEESKKTFAKLDIPADSKLRDISNFYFVPEPDFSTTRGIDISNSNEESEEDLANRYVMLMTPDGNIIRMSKKLGNIICCVAGEEPDPNCSRQIKNLQEKIANSNIGHSPGNFLDILSLVNLLQKNN